MGWGWGWGLGPGARAIGLRLRPNGKIADKAKGAPLDGWGRKYASHLCLYMQRFAMTSQAKMHQSIRFVMTSETSHLHYLPSPPPFVSVFFSSGVEHVCNTVTQRTRAVVDQFRPSRVGRSEAREIIHYTVQHYPAVWENKVCGSLGQSGRIFP